MKAISFPPIIGPRPRCLILGSMPGVASLRRGQYYAHPQNRFWWIMSRCLHFDAALPYEERCRKLTAAGIGLWDALQSCEREGSLDAAIAPDSLRANDIAGLCRRTTSIAMILLNGGKAAQCFTKLIAPRLPHALPWRRLPSTSPAHARMRPEEKLALWAEALNAAGVQRRHSRESGNP